MALNLSLSGGDNEYMDMAEAAMKKAKNQAAAAAGGGGIIASLLDAVGIHKTVAKGGKSGAAKKGTADSQGADAAPAPTVSAKEDPKDVLAMAESALVAPSQPVNQLPPSQQPTTDWGKATANALMLRPLGQRQIDPDAAARGVLVPVIPIL